MVEREQTDHVLVCDKCIAMTTDGVGWKAMLVLIVGDEDAQDSEEVAVYCRECAASEFA